MIIWPKENFSCGTNPWNPEREEEAHLARSGSQSEHRIRFVLPACRFSHLISLSFPELYVAHRRFTPRIIICYLPGERWCGVKIFAWRNTPHRRKVSKDQPPKPLSLIYGALLIVGSLFYSNPSHIFTSRKESCLGKTTRVNLFPCSLPCQLENSTWIMWIRKRDFKERKKITAFGVRERFNILPPQDLLTSKSVRNFSFLLSFCCEFPYYFYCFAHEDKFCCLINYFHLFWLR